MLPEIWYETDIWAERGTEKVVKTNAFENFDDSLLYIDTYIYIYIYIYLQKCTSKCHSQTNPSL